MDVIPRAWFTGSWQGAAEHLKCWYQANGHLGHKGEKIVWDAIWILTNASGDMDAKWVVNMEASDVPAVRCTGCRSASVFSVAALVRPQELIVAIGAVSVVVITFD